MGGFAGKRVLITGATSGIGRAGALRIAREGGLIVATGRDDVRLADLQHDLPQNAVVVKNDASDPQSAVELAALVREVGLLDGLWLNAGYAAVDCVEHIDADGFDAMINADVRGPVLQLAKLAGLLNDGASVVLTASTAAYEGSAMASGLTKL
jgi:NAD(P)-dependent dehydrogenase (short-subunit alcohol dehydrogenase family)